MNAVQLDRTFLKKPLYSVFLLLGLALLYEGFAWTTAFPAKLQKLTSHGGAWQYFGKFFLEIILPEICTVLILATLINQYHIRFNIKSVKLAPRSIIRYGLYQLPMILVSFLIFNPVTNTVRYLLVYFPNYSLSHYWNTFIVGTFTWDLYVRYASVLIIMGFVLIGVSLVIDYFNQREAEQEAAEAQAAEASQAALALSAAFTSKPASTSSVYLLHLRGRNAFGELDFPVSDVYFFTIEDRSYYAELAKGRYAVTKTLNELETELDPSRFFRIKRDYIFKRNAVLNNA
jgi:hypothetical protein